MLSPAGGGEGGERVGGCPVNEIPATGERDQDGWPQAIEDLKSLGGIHAVYAAGREDEGSDWARRWDEIASSATHAVSNAELEERRWGPGGREHFGDPHPRDFPGRDISHSKEHDREAGQ